MCILLGCLYLELGNGLNGIRLILEGIFCKSVISCLVCLYLLFILFINIYFIVICRVLGNWLIYWWYVVINVDNGYFLLMGINWLCNLLLGVCSDIVNVILMWLYSLYILGIIFDVLSVSCFLVIL